eukprot:6944519-Prymnesium_polylepis.1
MYVLRRTILHTHTAPQHVHLADGKALVRHVRADRQLLGNARDDLSAAARHICRTSRVRLGGRVR